MKKTLFEKRKPAIEGFYYLDKDVKEFIEEVKKVFHKGILYEGESIWKILDEKAGETDL